MATENFEKAGEIFQNAIEIEDPAQRERYLDDACKEDKNLRAEVEALLKAHAKAGDFLEGSDAAPNMTLDGPATIEGPGTRIGHYELLELIGEGGMGLVYLAEQKEPVKRRVALKIIKPGMDSKQVIARFEAERQVLALLDHPNIAHVLDAGTTGTGRPYFVMEYVKGMSITRYCDEHRLDVEQRLRLFREVCEGVHHAHQKGIIHRDIKPSNILISVHGDRVVPKIIDFGIAKAAASTLTEKTMYTFRGQLLGTPEYMSPEQVDLAAQDIDTRSDIYSLGVVLYELLAGVLPFDRESLHKIGFAELQRTLRESEPASPSVRLANMGQQAKAIADSRMTQVVPLARRLHRELEWIPLKAMRKDRCRRYKSASDMADDIQSYLNGNPLLAGPETAMYRVQKFVHKHAGSVATVALVSVAVIVGLVVSVILGCRAERARQQEAAARIQVEQALMRAEKAEKAAQEQRELAEEQRVLAEKQAEEYRRSLYIHRINLADVAHRDDNIGRMRKLLDSCPEDLRAWEWHRLNYISDQAMITLLGDIDGIYDVAFAPDGKRFVSAGADGTIKIWDAADGKKLMTLRGHEAIILSVTFSPDGKRIASVARNNKIKVWDGQSGKELMTLTGGVSLHNPYSPPWIWGPIAFSPDGKRIVSGSPHNSIKVWDADSGADLMTLSGHSQWLTGLVFTPDGKHIVSSSEDRTMRVWDANNGRQLMTLKGHMGGIGDPAVSPDGKRIVTVSDDRTAKIWDLATGTELKTLRGHDDWIRCGAFSTDGAQIATGDSAGRIMLWDAANGTELMTLLGHIGPVMSVAFSPDGKRIISGSYDGTVRMWEPGIDHSAPVTLSKEYRNMAFSPDGKQIVTSGSRLDKALTVCDAVTLDKLMEIENAGGVASFSPNGKRIISADGNDIHVWDATNGKKLMTLSGHESGSLSKEQDGAFPGWQIDIWSMSYSPDGTRIVSGGLDKTVRVWNAITGAEMMTLRGHEDWSYWPELSPVSSVAFSPDGELIASGSYDSTVRLWNAKTGAELMIMRGHSTLVSDVAFSPDGKRIASAGSDNTIRVCDVSTGDELLVLKGHETEALSVAFSPDGERIVSGSKDNTVRIWDATTGIEVQKLSIHGWVLDLCFSPDGKTLSTTSNEGHWASDCTITLWESDKLGAGNEALQTAISAREIVDELHEKHGSYNEVLSKLKDHTAITEPIRRAALQIANARLWEDGEKGQ